MLIQLHDRLEDMCEMCDVCGMCDMRVKCVTCDDPVSAMRMSVNASMIALNAPELVQCQSQFLSILSMSCFAAAHAFNLNLNSKLNLNVLLCSCSPQLWQ